MTVRPCVNAEEMRAAFGPIWHYFGQLPPTVDAVKHFERVLEPERVVAGFDGDAVVADRSRYDDGVALADSVATDVKSVLQHADAGGDDEDRIGLAALDHLGVTGDDRHAGRT